MKPHLRQPIFAAVLIFLPNAVRAQFAPPAPPPSTARIPSGGLTFSESGQFSGSVPSREAATGSLSLSLGDCIERGLKSNLGILVRTSEASLRRADRVQALSALLPKADASFTENVAQINLATFGFHISGIPQVVGPFSYTNLGASANVPVFDWTSIKNLRSAAESARAAALSIADGRDLVVQAVASGYFAIVASTARVESSRTRTASAEALYINTRDQHTAGVVPAIDELRSEVEWKTQQGRLLVDQNQLARDKLALGRAIGLPPGQEFEITDKAAYLPLDGLNPADLLKQAYEKRADYQSALAQVHAAEISREAASAERFPTVAVTGNYSDVGPKLSESHGTFAVAGSVSVNVFDGGRIRSQQQQASAIIEQRRNELADLRGRIDFEVRAALLDLSSAAQQVTIAQGNVELADQTLRQASDRLSAGVSGSVEVVLAQQALTIANDGLINSLYLHNLAKVALARAVGSAETALQAYLGKK